MSSGTNEKRAGVLIIKALWDDEAGVWSASSNDVAGLAIEAPTTESLIKRLKAVVPELLELNHARLEQTVPAELVISGRQSLSLAG